MEYEKETLNKLNELLVKNYDAEKGYINAEQEVENVNIKKFFKNRAEERSKFASQLRTEIIRHGELPEDSGSLKGTLHRNWMSLKATFSTNNEETILTEALRGERASLDEYDELLSRQALPISLTGLITEQRNAIEAALNSVELYEEIMSK